MDPCLRKHLRQTIYVATVTGYSPGGTETLSTPVARKAHVELQRRRGTAANGTESDGDHLIIVEEEVTLDDRIWLPGFDQTNPVFSRQPQEVIGMPDPRTGAISHYEVTL